MTQNFLGVHPKIKSELLLDPDRLEKLWERHGRSISNDFHVRKKFQNSKFLRKDWGAVQKKTFSFLTTEALGSKIYYMREHLLQPITKRSGVAVFLIWSYLCEWYTIYSFFFRRSNPPQRERIRKNSYCHIEDIFFKPAVFYGTWWTQN